MLVGLRLQNIALIESLDLAFEKGLTVLTGETGAGKSILLDALDVLFLLSKKGPGQARGSATVPVRVRAWIPYGSIRPMNLVILPSDPVISMVTDSG